MDFYSCFPAWLCIVCSCPAKVVFDVDSYTNSRSRSVEILLFLRLYEPYHRLLRLFRFNDPHAGSKGGSSSSLNSASTISLQRSTESPPLSRPMILISSRWKHPWRTRKLKPLGSAIKFDKTVRLRSFLTQSTNLRISRFRSKLRDRTRYQTEVTETVHVGVLSWSRSSSTRFKGYRKLFRYYESLLVCTNSWKWNFPVKSRMWEIIKRCLHGGGGTR